MNTEVGSLIGPLVVGLTSQYPIVDIEVASTQPASYFVRFYRSQTDFAPSDMAEAVQISCSTGNLCTQGAATNLVLGNNLSWASASVVPVELQTFEVD